LILKEMAKEKAAISHNFNEFSEEMALALSGTIWTTQRPGGIF